MTRRRHRPLYPVVAAIALGGAAASSCGRGFEDLPPGQDQQKIVQQQPDAGTTQPDWNNFPGGAAPYETFDAGH